MAGWGNVEDYSSSENINPCLVLPVSYIEFAKEETHLFRLLFINHMDLSMEEPKDFYKEAGNEKREKIFSDAGGEVAQGAQRPEQSEHGAELIKSSA